MSDEIISTLRDLASQMQAQHKQIGALAALSGTLLGVLQTKSLLLPGDVRTLFDLLNRICPDLEEPQVGETLAAAKLAAELAPGFLQLD